VLLERRRGQELRSPLANDAIVERPMACVLEASTSSWDLEDAADTPVRWRWRDAIPNSWRALLARSEGLVDVGP
jgi:hypothetical protein